MKRFIFLGLVLALPLSLVAEVSKKIHKKDYGQVWAFTTDEVVLICYKDGDIVSPVVEIKGKKYGLTMYADNKYGQKDLNAKNKYWREDPGIKGLRIDISPFREEAQKLCK